MKSMLLMAFIVMSCILAPSTLAQQDAAAASDASTASDRVRDLEKIVSAQTLRIQKLEQDLQARDEEVHMLVKIVSKQSDKDSADPDDGNTGSNDCDANPAARILKAHKTQFKAPGPAQR